MIFCQLKGGLGNMLFQIAASLSIAKDNDAEVFYPNLDAHLDVLNKDVNHRPKLNHAHEYKDLKIFKSLKYKELPSVIKKYNYPFHYESLKLEGSDVLIDGFFQSEKYFTNNREHIMNLFSIDEFINNTINEKYNHILNSNTTSIHIRRGDYLKYPDYHPLLSLEYFKNAIDLTKKDTDRFIIFSDDIEWCKQTFQGEKFMFVENEKDYIELYMMSLCKNNIISNSTFSWWSAWLNLNEQKTVVSPKQWFGRLINEDASDIIPETWIRI